MPAVERVPFPFARSAAAARIIRNRIVCALLLQPSYATDLVENLFPLTGARIPCASRTSSPSRTGQNGTADAVPHCSGAGGLWAWLPRYCTFSAAPGQQIPRLPFDLGSALQWIGSRLHVVVQSGSCHEPIGYAGDGIGDCLMWGFLHKQQTANDISKMAEVARRQLQITFLPASYLDEPVPRQDSRRRTRRLMTTKKARGMNRELFRTFRDRPAF